MRVVATSFALLMLGVVASADDTPDTKLGMPLVLNETFENGADSWKPFDSESFKVIEEDGNHVYALVKDSRYRPPVRSPQNIAIHKGLYVSDFVLEVELKSTTEDYGHRDMCVIFGYQDSSHYYYVHFGLKSDPHSNSIFLVNGKPRVSIARTRTDGTRWKDDTYHKIRIVRDVESGKIEVYFDNMDKPWMTAVDKTLDWGGFGVGSFDDTGNIDDYRVWGIKVEK